MKFEELHFFLRASLEKPLKPKVKRKAKPKPKTSAECPRCYYDLDFGEFYCPNCGLYFPDGFTPESEDTGYDEASYMDEDDEEDP